MVKSLVQLEKEAFGAAQSLPAQILWAWIHRWGYPIYGSLPIGKPSIGKGGAAFRNGKFAPLSPPLSPDLARVQWTQARPIRVPSAMPLQFENQVRVCLRLPRILWKIPSNLKDRSFTKVEIGLLSKPNLQREKSGWLCEETVAVYTAGFHKLLKNQLVPEKKHAMLLGIHVTSRMMLFGSISLNWFIFEFSWHFGCINDPESNLHLRASSAVASPYFLLGDFSKLGTPD